MKKGEAPEGNGREFQRRDTGSGSLAERGKSGRGTGINTENRERRRARRGKRLQRADQCAARSAVT